MAHALKPLQQNFMARPTGIIHVGASRGQEVQAYRESGIRPVLAIEPLDAPFAALVREIGNTPGMLPLQSCLGDREGRCVEFHVASNDGMSSSYLAPSGHVAAAPEVTFAASTVTMVTSTLDQVVAAAALAHGFDARQLDYLAMDTQGSELDILRGAEITLANVNFIFVEVSFGTLYEGSASQYEITDHLRERGFDLYDLHINQVGWGDALFVRSAWMAERRERFVSERSRRIAASAAKRTRLLHRLLRLGRP